MKGTARAVLWSPPGMTQRDSKPGYRRSDPRIAARFRVRFQSLDDLVATFTQDISRGGIFIQSDAFLPVGSVVLVNLELQDGGAPETAVARVAYTLGPEEAAANQRVPGMGMEFVDLRDSLAQRVAAHISRELAAAPESEPPAAPARILVVEDSSTQRKAIVEATQGMGHTVTTVENGLEALGRMMQDPPDLVLSDVQMPVMDGWQLLRLIRSRPALARVPVIFLTSLSDERTRLEGYRRGVDDYLSKPFNAEELQVRIDRALRRAETRPAQSADRGALRGDLSLVSLQSLLAFVHAEERTGLLLVAAPPRLATLHVRGGNVRRVDLADAPPGLGGLERLLHVLDWREGWFELTPSDITADDEIGMRTSHVLIEHARRRDEESR